MNLVGGVTETATFKADYWKIHTRYNFGRKDEIVKVHYDDMKHLEVQRIYYPEASRNAYESNTYESNTL